MSWVTGAFHDSPMTVNIAFLEAAMAILTSLVVSLLLLL
jgi:hypothetical protein